MDRVPGGMANWEKGYGDSAIAPDLETLRRIPWLDRTATVLCDVANHDGSSVVASPSQVLIARTRAQQMGYTPMLASELEFYLYKERRIEPRRQANPYRRSSAPVLCRRCELGSRSRWVGRESLVRSHR